MFMGFLPLFFKFFNTLIFVFFVLLEFSGAADTMNSTQSISDGNTLVSSGQTFELGFFSPGNSKNRYLGIWYKKIPDTVVWVANRNNPIGDSDGSLTISNNGTLVLLNGTKSAVWSSNLSAAAGSPVAQILDSGNLVVRDDISMNSETYLWQSFDYPCDTMLPGMKISSNLKTGLNRYLTSWKSIDDPTPGDFTYRIDMNGLPEIVVRMGSIKKRRVGPWNGVRLSGVQDLPNSVFKRIFIFNEDEFYYMFELYNSAVLTTYALNQSGFMQRFILKSNEWAVMYTRPIDLCENYGYCGANAVCRSTESPVCECLKGFTPNSQEDWAMLNWSSGCIRRTPLDCKSDEGFVNLAGLKLPDLLEFSLNKIMSLKECEAECLKNCSCTAYTNSNISGGQSGCLMWFGDLIDISEFIQDDILQDIYLRLPASEQEKISGSKMKKRLTNILVVSTISGILILGLVFWCIIWRKRSKRRGHKSKKEDLELPLFDLAIIARATNNFSHAKMLGEGGFGPVYKGDLSTGQEIAVKRLSKSSGQGLEEFMNEIVLIAKLQHKNLIKLLGYCIQGEERMLIYEYMPNKSLDYFIFDQNRSALLAWQKRFDIVMAIVRGLLYLHQDSRLQIIHRDLKTSNILLDSNLNPKISDFGLARIFEGEEVEAKTKRVVGTYGYMSPEYATDGRFSVKSDVFSLGVLLVEIVSGKKNRGFEHPDHHHNLLGHAWLLWNEGKALELMDKCLEDSFVESQVLRCIHVGLLCVQKFPQDRPVMSSVVHMLANEGVMLPQPKQPGFFIERSSIDTVAIPKEEEIHTENAVTISDLEGR